MRPGLCSPRPCAHLCLSRSHRLPPSPGLKRGALVQSLRHSRPSDHHRARRLANVTRAEGMSVPERSPGGAAGHTVRCGSPASREFHTTPAPELQQPPVPLPAGNVPVRVLITGRAGPREGSSAEMGAGPGPRSLPQRGWPGADPRKAEHCHSAS